MSIVAATVGFSAAHGDEIVDREEAPDVAGRIAPPLQAIVLALDCFGDGEILGPDGERETQRAVVQFTTSFAVDDRQSTSGDDLVEWVTELGDDHAPIGGVPVDVEPRRRRRCRAIAQHLPPAIVQVGLGDRHVVRDVVDDHTEAVIVGRVEQRPQALGTSELGAHLGVVDDVVAVQAAGDRLGNRRQVHMTDTERDEVVEDVDRVRKAERRRQLNSIGRNRDRIESSGHLCCLPTGDTDHSEPAESTGERPMSPRRGRAASAVAADPERVVEVERDEQSSQPEVA